jgi:membrane-bound metal-dependent hydrolase YbcI (DUF457 family)
VTAPLVPQAGPRVLLTSTVAATAIDVDHAIAARSFAIRATTTLATRPRSHSLITAAGAAALTTAAAGPAHGWAAFSALVSHFLHDAGDTNAPTPMLWPFRPARQLGRRWQLAGTLALMLGSVAVSRAISAPSQDPSADASRGDAGTAPARTA